MLRWSAVIFIFLSFYHVSGQTQCICVPFYQCANGKIITNGQGIIISRQGPVATISLQPKNCSNYFDVCCYPPQVNTSLQFSNNFQNKCGIRNSAGVGHSITGNFNNESQFAEFPWMVAVLYKSFSQTTYKFNCGGSLISHKVVLTAAHTVVKSGDYIIRAGEWDSQTTKEIYPHQDIKVSRVVVHPDYDAAQFKNDIALLFLEKSVKQASHRNFICLPSQSFVSTDNNCIVTGWGKDKFGQQGIYQTILKRLELPVVPKRKCLQVFRSTILGPSFDLHNSVMCAGGISVDACTGDGGGPLVCPIKGRVDEYQQVGIVSWGVGCGTTGIPGAYVDVAKFRDWIDEELNKRNLESTTYVFKP